MADLDFDPKECPYLVGLDEESDFSEESETEVPLVSTSKKNQDRQRKDAEYLAFAGTYFDEVDFESVEDATMPTRTVDELVQRLDNEYPKCPDIDNEVANVRFALSSTWLQKGHRKSVHERMKKELDDRLWSCPTCHKQMRVSDCQCGQPIDKHFREPASIPCAGFDPAIQAEHGSLVCVACMNSTSGWAIITEHKQLLHSIPDWLVFLRFLLCSVKKKSVLLSNLKTWQQEIVKYGKQYAPALQTILEIDSMAIGSHDVFFPDKPENQTRMYQSYKFDGIYSSSQWSDLWVPALNLLDTPQDWKSAYKGMCALGGQLGIALALWVKATNDYVPDPGRRQFLKKGETMPSTDPWTAGYLRYTSPYDIWLPALDRLICFWTPLTVRGPGKCLPALTIGINELLYNLVKSHVTAKQQRARAEHLATNGGNMQATRVYKVKRGKSDRGRDHATGNSVRTDTPNMEDFATMYTAASKMITDHHQVPIDGVNSTGAYHFVNYVLTTCNAHRSRYSSKYQRHEKETPVINTCYSNFISFVRILKLYGVALTPPAFPTREDMKASRTDWRLPRLVGQVVQDVPALKTKLATAMRYIYTGVPLRRAQKLGDLITQDMRNAILKLDEGGTGVDSSGGATDIAQCYTYVARLNHALGTQAIKLTYQQQTLDLKSKATHEDVQTYRTAMANAQAAFEERIQRLRAQHAVMMAEMDSYMKDLELRARQFDVLGTTTKNQLTRISNCQAAINQIVSSDLTMDSLQAVVKNYNLDIFKPVLKQDSGLNEKGEEMVMVPRSKYEAFQTLASGIRKHTT